MISTRIFTFFKGRWVGRDYYGNNYYEEKFWRKADDKHAKRRRWVIYQGINEASKVVPEWHRWLHYTCDEVPSEFAPHYEWQKSHLPNMTGTPQAYVPFKMLEQSAKKYYSSWKPH